MDKKTKVEIRTIKGIKKIPAVVVGALAAHAQLIDGGLSEINFTITHLPSGFGFPADFHSLEDAVAAAKKIQHLRNDWICFDPTTVTKEFLNELKKIYNDYNAFIRNLSKDDPRWKVAKATYATDLNGYKSQEVV